MGQLTVLSYAKGLLHFSFPDFKFCLLLFTPSSSTAVCLLMLALLPPLPRCQTSNQPFSLLGLNPPSPQRCYSSSASVAVAQRETSLFVYLLFLPPFLLGESRGLPLLPLTTTLLLSLQHFKELCQSLPPSLLPPALGVREGGTRKSFVFSLFLFLTTLPRKTFHPCVVRKGPLRPPAPMLQRK